MRLLMSLLVATLLLHSGLCVAAPTVPPAQTGTETVATGQEQPPKRCDSAQLELLAKEIPKQSQEASKENNDPFVFRLGETLRISVRGECAAQLTRELAQNEVANAVQLRLDDVPMRKLPVAVSQGARPGELILAFHLQRLPQAEENRSSWDALLEKQHGGYVMPLPITLTLGRDVARAVRSAAPFRFYVATGKQVGWTIAVGLLVFAASYFLLVRSPSALRDTRNGLYSLGKSQMAFWGLLVMLTFTGLWFLTGAMERIPEQVLILLGISGATGLSAIVIGNSKQTDQHVELEPGTTSKGFWRDICDDGNGLSFHRMQVVIWTLLLGMVFVRSVANVMSMPEFPETLLIMMGISNGVYLGFKFPEKP